MDDYRNISVRYLIRLSVKQNSLSGSCEAGQRARSGSYAHSNSRVFISSACDSKSLLRDGAKLVAGRVDTKPAEAIP
jgi:hypothetical protein